ncbi:hypothetical protein CFN78_08065 [Amycolatopsis antarctica]|uniref:Uncharacterized protein n=1 Tax=Amycolatopsis antarctica TaxID=1854586 RepID=A0A263D7X2_9PSEU|nr:hypothetical protein [Amycolatopsis antarctica]OZM73495.1 hypothetical protein CFN78_08065 [Amycolatopsis antarctica]
MPGFRTNQNGKAYPITPKKGGGVVVVAGALACGVVAVGGVGGAGTAGTAADSAATQALRGKTSQSKGEAKKGRYEPAWNRLGWKQLKKTGQKAATCVAHSFGQVQEFFARNPCTALDRTLLALGDGSGGTILVAISWVRMPTAGVAQELEDLAHVQGTGNVTPLATSLLDIAGVEFTGEYYDSDRRGSMTVIAEATPADGGADEAMMRAVVEVAKEFPPP